MDELQQATVEPTELGPVVRNTTNQEGYSYDINNTPYVQSKPMTTAEAYKILTEANLDANQVLSADNIASTLSPTTTSTTTANSIDDLLGIRNDIYNTTGVNTAQTAYQTALKAAQDAQNALNNIMTGLSNRAVSVSKITGQQSQAQKTYGSSVDALNDAANLAYNDYIAKKQEADTQFSIRESEIKEKRSYQLQYSGAGIKLSDDWETVSKKLADYEKKQKKEAYKDSLKQIALEYGIKTKGLSTKELEKKIAKVNKEAKAQAKQEADLKLESLRMDIANSKSLIANRGKESSSLSIEEKSFYDDVDKLRNQMSEGNSNWSYAWNYIKNKYPGLSVQAIDNALGLDYRSKYDQ